MGARRRARLASPKLSPRCEHAPFNHNLGNLLFAQSTLGEIVEVLLRASGLGGATCPRLRVEGDRRAGRFMRWRVCGTQEISQLSWCINQHIRR